MGLFSKKHTIGQLVIAVPDNSFETAADPALSDI